MLTSDPRRVEQFNNEVEKLEHQNTAIDPNTQIKNFQDNVHAAGLKTCSTHRKKPDKHGSLNPKKRY